MAPMAPMAPTAISGRSSIADRMSVIRDAAADLYSAMEAASHAPTPPPAATATTIGGAGSVPSLGTPMIYMPDAAGGGRAQSSSSSLSPSAPFSTWLSVAVGLVVGLCLFALLRWGYRVLRPPSAAGGGGRQSGSSDGDREARPRRGW